MKVYTKSGDKGTTSLVGGTRVAKNNIRIDAYGTVDELIAYVAVVNDFIEDNSIKKNLYSIEDRLMVCAAILATETESTDINIPKLSDEDIVWLENRIDLMEEKLPPISNFVLPGGHKAVSFSHVARTVCRRAERIVLSLYETSTVPEVILRYLNRLSDYFFVLSRFLVAHYRVKEIPWQPQLEK